MSSDLPQYPKQSIVGKAKKAALQAARKLLKETAGALKTERHKKAEKLQKVRLDSARLASGVRGMTPAELAGLGNKKLRRIDRARKELRRQERENER